MANDFSSDPTCLAWWRFENGALTTDSKGANTLTASGTPPTSDTTNFFEGAGSAAFVKASNMYYTIADAALPASFPFKNGGQNGGTFFLRVRMTVAQIQTIFIKLTGNYGIKLATTATNVTFGTGSGTSVTTTTLFNYTSYLNTWLTFAISLGNPGAVRIKCWNETGGAVLYDNTFIPAQQAVAANVAFYIGATSSGTDCFTGQIDDFVVFDRVLSYDEMDEIRAATFPVTYSGAAVTPYSNTNNFSGDPWICGVYNFETGALSADSSGAGNTLTPGSTFQTPRSINDYVQGSASGGAEFVTPGGRLLSLADASLSAGHPLKSTGPARREYTISCWVKFTSYTLQQWVWAKYDTTGNSRTIGLYTIAATGELRVMYGYSTSSEVSYATGWTPKLNRWYHITVAVIGVSGYGRIDIRVYDSDRKVIVLEDRNFTGQVQTQFGAAAFTVGSRWNNGVGSQFLDGRIDELVVWSRVLSIAEQDKVIAGTYSYVDPRNNVYKDHSGKLEMLYNFESGALTTDSASGNTLQASAAPTQATDYYRQGLGSSAFASASNQYWYITDAGLPASFPGKLGTTNKKITMCLWFRQASLLSNARIIGKYYNTGNKKTYLVYSHTDGIIRLVVGDGGSNSTTYVLWPNATVAGRWYHMCVAIDGDAGTFWGTLFDEGAGLLQVCPTTALTTALGVSNADFMIGRSGIQATGTDASPFNGNMDEIAVYSKCLNYKEMNLVRRGIYTGPAAYSSPSAWYFDPDVMEEFDGLAWDTPLKYPQGKVIAATEDIYFAETPAVSSSTLVTATSGSLSITTAADNSHNFRGGLTAIQIEGDDTIYTVNTWTSTTITLYRPYRGSSGSGKILKVLRPKNLYYASGQMQPTSIAALASTGRRPWNFGTNKTTRNQTGFSIISARGSSTVYTWQTTYQYHDFARVMFLQWGYPMGTTNHGWTDCTFDKLFISKTAGSWSNSANLSRCVFTNPISEETSWLYANNSCTEVEFNDLEIGYTAGNAIIMSGWNENVIFRRTRNAGYATRYFLSLDATYLGNVLFIDPVFDELASGCPGILLVDNGWYTYGRDNILIKNPKTGAGTLITCDASYGWRGSIKLAEINGDPTLHSEYMSAGEQGKAYGALLSPDYSVYRTQPPAVKVKLNQSVFWMTKRFEVPMTGGVTKTISAYLRKNASYGSLTLPKMVIRYPLGTGLSQSTNEVTSTMSDVTDTWSLVSQSITPSIDCVVLVTFYFKSATAGAIAYIDDFGVA